MFRLFLHAVDHIPEIVLIGFGADKNSDTDIAGLAGLLPLFDGADPVIGFVRRVWMKREFHLVFRPQMNMAVDYVGERRVGCLR